MSIGEARSGLRGSNKLFVLPFFGSFFQKFGLLGGRKFQTGWEGGQTEVQ